MMLCGTALPVKGTHLVLHKAPRRNRHFGAAPLGPIRVRAAAGPSSREPWSPARFINTVLFFNGPRSLEDLARPITKLFSPAKAPSQAPLVRLDGTPVASPHTSGATLVVGGTGGVGARVVKRLLSQGKPVRALVRDIAKARDLLGGADREHPGNLEVVLADITQPQTLQAEAVAGVSAVVCASAVRVQPKEGDTVDRKKYYQGIKFFDPEVVGDTPESVELRGVQNLLRWAGAHAGIPVTIFSAGGPGGPPVNAAVWGALDDVVMGGVSDSGFALVGGAGEGGAPAGVFRGTISTANSGGFASVRTRNFEPPLDLSGCDGLELRLRGDGLRYKLFVRTLAGWDAPAFAQSFDTAAGEWQTVRLPFKAFRPIFRARTMTGGPALDASTVYSVQLMLSKFEYDQDLNPKFRDGPFALPVESIRAYVEAPQAAPRWIHVSSAGVTRWNRPGIDVNAEPPAVRMNEALGGLLTYKLAGEDAVRASGVPFAIVRPVALTEEPAGAELIVDQGDTIKGKISRDDVAELVVACLEQPAALNKTFEVKSTVPFQTPFEPTGNEPPRDWAALLAPLRERVTGRTVDGVYTGREPEAAALGARAELPVAR